MLNAAVLAEVLLVLLMELVYQRFESYDFESDRRFQDGLKLLHESNSDGDGNRRRDMKLFFYNRFVEPIDQTGYKQWSSASPPVAQVDSRVEQQDQDSDCESSKNRAAETSADTKVTQLSFAEVMRLIQEGKEVPGAIKLDIKPSNQSPTPSHMERVLKPWERASSSN